MFSPSFVCGINFCSAQLQDIHDMQVNVDHRNLQLVSFADHLTLSATVIKKSLSSFFRF